jgi:hypothetical protein
MSSIRSAALPNPSVRSDTPVPRLSNAISRPISANRRWRADMEGISQIMSRFEMKPATWTMSIGPRPTVWYAMSIPSIDRAYLTGEISVTSSPSARGY